LETPNKHHW
jgi:serine/threonine protein phosphatase PrpC